LGYVTSFFFANTFKRIKSVVHQKNYLPTDFTSLFIKSFSYGLVGFIIAHCVSLKFVFDHTEYIRLRMFYEKSIGFDRNEVLEKYEEYPFAHKVDYLFTDLEVRNKIAKSKNNSKTKYGEDMNLEKEKKKKVGKIIEELSPMENIPFDQIDKTK
jgi:hypothetical protein